ncbi:MAG: NnrS family protein [Betaproteobacteria bacterium]|nr:NnrS family protein [Betaproteobacteria bacterium]MBI2959394.1 NnrS family protein [Betaproteobacteria bacterium]
MPPTSDPGSSGFALWNLGFRPFYLLAGFFAALSVLGWAAQFVTWTGVHVYGGDPRWHAHEMIFGFAFAVIVGFLFTAGSNWTGRATPTGMALAAIAALWIAARAAVFASLLLVAAAADAAFAIAAAVGLGIPLAAARNRRNYFFIALLLALGAAGLAFKLGMAGAIAFPAQRGLQTALDLILFVICVMGGRVIPMFTANAIPGTKPVRLLWLERTALASVLVLLAGDVLNLAPVAIAAIAGAAAIAHAARLALWKPWVTTANPILWILHLSYAWIPVHLALRTLTAVEMLPLTLANHALAVGAAGGLIIGMMTRTSRGHTGRVLRASRIETLCYVLVHLAAAVRVFLPLAVPELQLAAIAISGILWSVAFGAFTVAYWPILTRARVDGKPG